MIKIHHRLDFKIADTLNPRFRGKVIQTLTDFEDLCQELSKKNGYLSEEELKSIKKPFMMLKDAHSKEDKIDEFCSKASEIAEETLKKGKENIAGIILSEIIKSLSCKKTSQAFIKAVEESIALTKKNGDNAHLLGRLTTLEMFCKENKDRKLLYKVLKEKITCTREILADYNLTKQNFHSLSKELPSIESFKYQLAKALESLAEILNNQKKNKSTEYLKEARALYLEIGMTNKAQYVDNKLIYRKQGIQNVFKSTHTRSKKHQKHFAIDSDRRSLKKGLKT